MRKWIYKARHIILFTILIGSDLLIGHIGYTAGAEGESYGAVIAIAVIIVVVVELLFRGER